MKHLKNGRLRYSLVFFIALFTLVFSKVVQAEFQDLKSDVPEVSNTIVIDVSPLNDLFIELAGKNAEIIKKSGQLVVENSIIGAKLGGVIGTLKGLYYGVKSIPATFSKGLLTWVPTAAGEYGKQVAFSTSRYALIFAEGTLVMLVGVGAGYAIYTFDSKYDGPLTSFGNYLGGAIYEHYYAEDGLPRDPGKRALVLLKQPIDNLGHFFEKNGINSDAKKFYY